MTGCQTCFWLDEDSVEMMPKFRVLPSCAAAGSAAAARMAPMKVMAVLRSMKGSG